MLYGLPSDLELMARSIISQQVHGNASEIPFSDKSWQIVNSKINWVNNHNKHWVSLGSSKSRERLFFDENSALVTDLKAQAVQTCAGKGIGETLDTVNTLINNLTAVEGVSRSDVERTLDAKLDQLLLEKRLSLPLGADIDVHFDELAEKKILVCRHKGLLAASILAHLVENQILPEGCVRQYRSNLKIHGAVIGAHTWSVYRDATTGDLWMCDPRWQTAKNVTKEFMHLARRYGGPAMSDMVKRLDVEDRIHLIEEVIAHEDGEEILDIDEIMANKEAQEKPSVEEGKKDAQTFPIAENKAPASNFDAWAQGKADGSYRVGYYTKYWFGIGSKKSAPVAPAPTKTEKSDYEKWVEGNKSAYHFGYYTYWALKGDKPSSAASSSAPISEQNIDPRRAIKVK